jgi:hypothetical protein
VKITQKASLTVTAKSGSVRNPPTLIRISVPTLLSGRHKDASKARVNAFSADSAIEIADRTNSPVSNSHREELLSGVTHSTVVSTCYWWSRMANPIHSTVRVWQFAKWRISLMIYTHNCLISPSQRRTNNIVLCVYTMNCLRLFRGAHCVNRRLSRSI